MSDVARPDGERLAALEADNARLQNEVEQQRRVAARSLASYQQRALQMEIIRQQNDDLDRLAADLARSKREEEARSREIEEGARLKSEFLANFSHEIRTPLNGIIGYSDLLMREEGSRLTPHGRRDLNVIKSNARTLLSLINDILDLSKIEAGRVEVVRERVDVSNVAEECAATVRELLKSKDVVLAVRVSSEARFAFTDALKLRQVLLNLLSNAAKFTETGEIVAELTLEEPAKGGGELRIVVEDTGVGIPADQLQHIFEKFRQVDGSATRKVGGTGLGLAIVRELTRVLGGTVEVRSTVGRGSRFVVHLPGSYPRDRALKASPRPTLGPGPDGHGDGRLDGRPDGQGDGPLGAPAGRPVLIVDDDPLIQQLVRAALESEGFEVAVASDGMEALRLARELQPAAILLDLILPRLGGWEVLTELKSDPRVSHLPVIILSVEEERARGFSLGAREYLVKPVDPERLVGVVRGAILPDSGEILVVDDEQEARELVVRQLRRAGFVATEARDGEEALLRARVSPPSLMILDLMMPNVDGFEVMRRLRADQMNTPVSTPVVVLTAKQLAPDEERLLRTGLARIIHKGGLALEEVVQEAKRLVLSQRTIEAARVPKILYVEDSLQNRDIVRRYLYGEFELIEAEDGEHGIECARRYGPDLILMDLSLPRIDGWEATRRLKADERFKRTPIVALTAHASRDDEQRARDAGCVDYLTKPVERDRLIATIRRQLVRELNETRAHA